MGPRSPFDPRPPPEGESRPDRVIDLTFVNRLLRVREVLADVAAATEEERAEMGALLDVAIDAVENLEIAGEELAQANEELRSVRAIAEDERQRYYELFDLAPDGFLVTDAVGLIREANRAAGALLGVSPALLEGKPLGLYVAGDEPARFDEVLRRVRHEHVVEERLDVCPRHGPSFPASVRVARDWRDIAAPNGVGVRGRLQWALRNDSEQVQLEDRLSFLAMHDPLTGLPNRSLLLDRLDRLLAQARREESDVAVFFIDLDGFKDINDSLGHAAGDELLIEVAHRLTGVARGTDTAARLGGDEFIVAWAARAHPTEVEHFAGRVAEQFHHVFVLEGNEVSVSASIGVSVAPGGASDPETLLYEADMAMYEVKHSGRAGRRVFDADLRERVGGRLTLMRDLRRAVERDELDLVAQPQVHLRRGGVVGAEVLLRWRHPRFGELQPARFIPLAERSGLIIDLGRWVIDRTAALVAAHPAVPSWSVNLSARQFAHPGLVGDVIGSLDRHGADPSKLCLEITESTVMGDLGAAEQVMTTLVERGARFAIDDFGTGYSSLRYLAHLPVSVLKVDPVFVADMVSEARSRKIVEAIAGLADGLGFDLVAEGVETEAQELLLREMGVAVAQGFRYSRPLAPHDLATFVAAGAVAVAAAGVEAGEAAAPTEPC